MKITKEDVNVDEDNAWRINDNIWSSLLDTCYVHDQDQEPEPAVHVAHEATEHTKQTPLQLAAAAAKTVLSITDNDASLKKKKKHKLLELGETEDMVELPSDVDFETLSNYYLDKIKKCEDSFSEFVHSAECIPGTRSYCMRHEQILDKARSEIEERDKKRILIERKAAEHELEVMAQLRASIQRVRTIYIKKRELYYAGPRFLQTLFTGFGRILCMHAIDNIYIAITSCGYLVMWSKKTCTQDDTESNNMENNKHVTVSSESDKDRENITEEKGSSSSAEDKTGIPEESTNNVDEPLELSLIRLHALPDNITAASSLTYNKQCRNWVRGAIEPVDPTPEIRWFVACESGRLLLLSLLLNMKVGGHEEKNGESSGNSKARADSDSDESDNEEIRKDDEVKKNIDNDPQFVAVTVTASLATHERHVACHYDNEMNTIIVATATGKVIGYQAFTLKPKWECRLISPSPQTDPGTILRTDITDRVRPSVAEQHVEVVALMSCFEGKTVVVTTKDGCIHKIDLTIKDGGKTTLKVSVITRLTSIVETQVHSRALNPKFRLARKTTTLQIEREYVYVLALAASFDSRRGQFFLCSCSDGTVRVVTPAGATKDVLIASFDRGHTLTSCHIITITAGSLSDRRVFHLAITCSDIGSVRIWNLDTNIMISNVNVVAHEHPVEVLLVGSGHENIVVVGASEWTLLSLYHLVSWLSEGNDPL